jgi:AraC-like DNA-binding protein
MLFNFNQKSSILLIFFVHGIVFSALLGKKFWRDDDKAAGWLSVLVFLCALYLAPFMFGYAGWYFAEPYRDIMFFVPFQQLFLIGPVIFFYTRSLLDKSFALSKKDFVHFVPAILYLIYSLVVFITDKLVLSEYYFYADGRDKDLAFWYQMAGLISMAFYLILSLRFYSIYKKITVEVVSFAETIAFEWVQRFLLAFLVILILRVLFFILNPEWGEFGSKFWYYLCFSLLFYYISISGYANSVKAVIAFQKFDSSEETIEDLPEKETVEIENLEDWKQKVERVVRDEKAFQNPELTLSDVAEELGITPKKLSQIINQGFQMNFNDFINFYRTEAVIEKLQSGESSSKNLLGIAFECGFNSKSTFNRAFKKQTSLTPKDFLQKVTDSFKE